MAGVFRFRAKRGAFAMAQTFVDRGIVASRGDSHQHHEWKDGKHVNPALF